MVTGGLVGADVAADQAGLVAVDAFQSHELGGEMVAVDRFLAAVAHRTRQVTEAPAAVADCLLSNALRRHREAGRQREKIKLKKKTPKRAFNLIIIKLLLMVF